MYRTGFFKTSFEIRKFILRGTVYLNGFTVTKPSVYLKKNDLVQINFLRVLPQYFKSPIICNHLEIDFSTFSYIYLGHFSVEKVPYLNISYMSFLNYIFKR